MSKTYLYVTACNKYDKKYYGPDATLRMPVSDARKFRDFFREKNPKAFVIFSGFDEFAPAHAPLTNLELYAKMLKPGDRFIWYHSGHGTYRDTFRGRQHGRCMYDRVLWDAEVAAVLAKFPEGTTVLTISDTCYAESNSRSVAAAPVGNYLRARYTSIVQDGDLMVPLLDSKQRYAAAIMHLSASAAAQVAWETEKGGIFTTAMLEELEANPEMTPGKLPFALRQRLRRTAPWCEQTPRLWGNNASKPERAKRLV